MKTTNQPSAGAMRAAKHIIDTAKLDFGLAYAEQVRVRAEIIDRETRAVELVDLRDEVSRLKKWIRREGVRTDTCTYHVLGKEVCAGCRCWRAKNQS